MGAFHLTGVRRTTPMNRTVWAPFPQNTDYFNPSRASFMINYRVENLAALLTELRKEGVTVEDRIEEYEYGRFAWIMDSSSEELAGQSARLSS